MGVCHETGPLVERDGEHNPARVQDCVAEGQAGRTQQEVVTSDGKDIAGLADASDPREQILALYDEYRPRLFRYIRSMSLDRDQAEEVIQETFMRLTTELLRETDVDNVQGWIVRVAHNLAVDALKRRARDGMGNSESSVVLESRIDPTLNPEEAYSKKEQARCMEVALATFSEQQRNCFHMRVQGFRYKDIGLAFGISEQRAAFVVKQVAVRLAAICG
jgi:RNA polymerase sigma-70 factor, ECF subfamily